MSLDRATVERACAAWLYVPDEAKLLEDPAGRYLMVRYPEWFDPRLQVVRFDPAAVGSTGRELDAVVEELLARARATGDRQLLWWVRIGHPPVLDEVVMALGGVRQETLDVFALDLTAPTAARAPLPEGLELRWVTDLPTARECERVMVEVFGDTPTPDHRLAEVAEEGRRELHQGGSGRLVAYLDGEPVGASAVSMADPVARLWGGAVRERFRGRGVYRAMLAHRLDHARSLGRRLALVKGRVNTSGPILRRAGFSVFGQERSYRIDL